MAETPTPLTAGLDPDAPRDPEYTIAVAQVIPEALRVLNHHTIAGADMGGLEYVGHAARVVDHLAVAANRQRQLLKQLDDFTRRFDWDRDLYTSAARGSAGTQMSVASIALDRAAYAARQLEEALTDAGRALGTIGHNEEESSDAPTNHY